MAKKSSKAGIKAKKSKATGTEEAPLKTVSKEDLAKVTGGGGSGPDPKKNRPTGYSGWSA